MFHLICPSWTSKISVYINAYMIRSVYMREREDMVQTAGLSQGMMVRWERKKRMIESE
jgi:hypothetical protein